MVQSPSRPTKITAEILAAYVQTLKGDDTAYLKCLLISLQQGRIFMERHPDAPIAAMAILYDVEKFLYQAIPRRPKASH